MKLIDAIKNKTTVHQHMIRDVTKSENVLKSGANNKKLGNRVTKGKWKGKYIYSLTRIERETCPDNCLHYSDCYANRLHLGVRYKSNNLQQKLSGEIPKLLKKHEPNGILIRLHVAGDFDKVSYVTFWQNLLEQYSDLAVFGYTAHWDNDIAEAIMQMNKLPNCFIRFSQNKESTNEISFAVREDFDGKCFICPNQTGKTKNCSTCSACWETTKSVKFLTH